MKINLTCLLAFSFFGILVSGLMSCEKKSDCCTIIDVDVAIHYQTQSGENLINSDVDFSESNIKLYYKNGSDYEYAYNSNLDYPNYYNVYEGGDGKLVLTVFPSNYYDGNQSITLLQLNESVTDTLICEFELDVNKEICKKAWLNGVEMNNRFMAVKK